MSQNYPSWGPGAYTGRHPPPHASGPPFTQPPAQGAEPRIKLPPLASLAPVGSEHAEQQGHQHGHHHSVPPTGPPQAPPREVAHGYAHIPPQGPPPAQYVDGPPPHVQAYHTQPPPPPPPPSQQQYQHQHQTNSPYDDPRRHGDQSAPTYGMSQASYYTTAPTSRGRIMDMHSGEHFEVAESRGYPPSAPPYAQGNVLSEGHPLHHMDAHMHATGSMVPHPAAMQERQCVDMGGAIPNLLGEDKAHLVSTIKFELALRQQPKAARACGAGERDRRTIDPPPVLQLLISSDALSQEEIAVYLRHEPYVMTAEIFDETGTHECAKMPAEFKHQRRMTGSLVGNPFFGKDEFGGEGTFFPFGDLSVRSLGTYTLKFKLFMIDPQDPRRRAPCLDEITSSPFQSYAAKGFPGIEPSSKLVRVLREQGCIISIKKGHDKKRPYRDSAEPSGGEDEDESTPSNRRRRDG